MTARTKLRTPRPALLALLPLALLTSCMAPAPPPEPGADSIRASAPGEIPDPYAEGASFAGRYRIESVERHPEYTRLYFSGPEGESGVEIVRDSGAPTAWSANGHRVQPAPESSPPMELLEAVLAQLEIAAPSRLRSSALAGHGRGADPSIRGQTLAALAATGLAALLWIVLFGFWLREHRAWRLEATLWIGLVSFAAIGWGLLGPASIPVEHMTVLHETNLGNLLGTLLAIDLHAGPYFAELAGALTRLGWLPLRALIFANIGLSLLNALLFFGVVRVLLCARGGQPELGRGRTLPVALALTWVFLLNPASVHAALSELPTKLLETLMLMSALPLALLRTQRRLRSALSLTCFALLALLGALMAATRIEHLVFPATALGLFALGALGVSWARLGLEEGEGVLERLRSWLAGRPRRIAWVAGLILVSSAILSLQPFWEGWLPGTLAPIDPNLLVLPWVASSVIPIGSVLLFLAGAYAALRFGGFYLLPLPFALLFKLYAEAAHQALGPAPYELLRYGTMLLLPFMLLAALGARMTLRWLRARSANRQLTRWQPLLLAALLALPLTPLEAELFDEEDGALPMGPILSRNVQREARFLVESLEANPGCLLISTVGPAMAAGGAEATHVAIDGAALGLYSTSRDGERALSLAEFIEHHAQSHPCILYYRGTDCAREGFDGCEERVPESSPLREARLRSRPYNLPTEYGRRSRDLHLELRRIHRSEEEGE